MMMDDYWSEQETVSLDDEQNNREFGNIESSLEYFKKFAFAKEVKILEIGCSYGSLLYNINKLGYPHVFGVDIDRDLIAEGKSRYQAIADKLAAYPGDELPFSDSSFDVVLMFDVIEHIPDIKNFLTNQVNRVLKQKGFFVFQTPNKLINVPWVMINQKTLFPQYKEEHCSLQSHYSFVNLLKEAGFYEIITEKHDIYTAHNKTKVKRALGDYGVDLLYLARKLPISVYPNFWGYCRKK